MKRKIEIGDGKPIENSKTEKMSFLTVRIGEVEPLFYFFENIKVGRAHSRAPTKPGSRVHICKCNKKRPRRNRVDARTPVHQYLTDISWSKCTSGLRKMTKMAWRTSSPRVFPGIKQDSLRYWPFAVQTTPGTRLYIAVH